MACALLGVVPAVACDGLEDSPTAPTVENVEEHPNRFLGERVTLIGEVDEVYSSRAFELEELKAVFDEEVLVVTRTPIQLTGTTLRDDLSVFVTGEVNKLVTADVERELNWDLDQALEVEWQDRPVIIAEQIEAVETFAHWSEREHPEGQLVSMWAIYAAPSMGFTEGATVDLQDVRVAERRKQTMWVGLDGGPELFVVPAATAALGEFDEGAEVDLKGVLRRVPEAEGIPKAWRLTDEEMLRLESGDLYLEVSEVQAREPSAARAPGPQQEQDKEG